MLVLGARAVVSVENVGGKDPRECPKASDELAETHLGEVERAWALEEVAKWRPPEKAPGSARKRAASDEVSERAMEWLTQHSIANEEAARSAGGGRVSRPPQSASRKLGQNARLAQTLDEANAKRAAAFYALGLPFPSNGLCVTPSPSAAPDDTRTESERDAKPANTHPDILADSPLLLAQGIDTLEVSWFDVVIAPAELKRLEVHKILVQSLPGDGPESRFEFGGQSWKMSPSGGRRHQYLLEHESGVLAISKCPSKTVPTFRVKLYSETLWRLGTKGAWEWMRGIVDAVHAPEGASEEAEEQPPEPRSVISRVDLCADFLHLPLETAELDDFVCRPRARSKWKKLESGWKRIPQGEEKGDRVCAAFYSGLRTTGLSFGKGSMKVTIYDKVQEIKEQSPDKVWLYGHWMRCYACGAAGVEHEAVFSPRAVTIEGPKAKEGSKAPTLEGYAGCEKTGCAAFVPDPAYFMVERECENCNARGKVTVKVACKACRGGKRKKITCGVCNATGETDAERQCHECKGKKTRPDRAIRVEVLYRREALSEFVKAVERTCWKCAGLGTIRLPRYACQACSGEGGRECLACRGTGQKARGPCRSCDATGKRTCGRCHGAGFRSPKEVVCGTCRAAEGDRGSEGQGWVADKPDPREVVDPRLPLVLRADVNETTGEVTRPKAGKPKKLGRARNTEDDLELLLDTFEGLMASRSALWRYAMGGGKGVRAWLAWRRPSATEPQRTRWPLRPEWVAVQRLPDWTKDDTRRDELTRVQRKRAKAKKILPSVLGMLSTYVALRRDQDEEEVRDFGAALVLVEYEGRELFAERERKGIKHSDWASQSTWKLEENGRWGLHGQEVLERGRRELAAAAT